MPRIVPTPGMILQQGKEVWEVVEFNGDDQMKVKILECGPHVGTYLHVGRIYDVERHKDSFDRPGDLEHYQVWEIPPEDMDRDSSQMLLYFWPEGDVGIELDF